MKKVIGFAILCIVVGMILALVLPYLALEILVIVIGLFAGYHLFCC